MGDVAKKSTTAVAAYDYGDEAGAGFDNQTNDDMLIPFLKLLEGLSPELKSEEDGGLKDAKQGMLCNSVTGELFKAREGCHIVPVDTQHVFVEWRPREQGGGFVAVHELNSPIVKKAKEDAAEFGRYKTADGNDLIETYYIYAMQVEGPDANEPDTPIIIAFTGTRIKSYKRINTQMRTVKGRPPIYAFRLRVESRAEKNNKGEFHVFDVKPARDSIHESLIPPTLDGNPHPLLVAGRELQKMVRDGMARAAYETQDDAPSDGASDAGMDADTTTPF